MKQILLNNAKNHNSVNVVNSEYIGFTTNQRSFSPQMIESSIDFYELYLKERNECKNYKMIFTLHPYMSNVLFNPFTEIVYNEGGVESGIVGGKDRVAHYDKFQPGARNAVTRQAMYNEKWDRDITRRHQLLRDTEYSHPFLGGVTYHCGLDIFNNHYLRSNGYFAMQTTSSSDDYFNTLESVMYYGDGKKVEYDIPDPIVTEDGSGAINKKTTHLHMFTQENCSSFQNAFKNNIKDENGWVGFYNKSYAPIKNLNKKDGVYTETINRCLNNLPSCSFVDMYPDRTLFSFLPKINYSNDNPREEYNWAWFLTYPYEHTLYDSNNKPFDFFNENGLKIIWNTSSSLKSNGKDLLEDKNAVMRDGNFVYFRTKCKHNLSPNDAIIFTYGEENFSLTVSGVGDKNMANETYYFYVSYNELADEFGELSLQFTDEAGEKIDVFYVEIPDDMYVAKIVNGVPCKYYVRKFKKLKEITSTVNKAAFSRTIYNDNIVHLLYDENVNVSNLRDNWGRDISEIYLTLVKKNVGYKDYYYSGTTSPAVTEFSHCFGRITSGFNFESNKNETLVTNPKSRSSSIFRDYNVRSLYNLERFENITPTFLKTMGISFMPPTPIEDEITETTNVFYGDFVEFSPTTVIETILEDVHHRFNTAQRETKLDGKLHDITVTVGDTQKNIKIGFPCDFSKLVYDEIIYDDFDFKEVGGNVNVNGETKVSEIANFEVRVNNGGLRNDAKLYNDSDNSPRDNIFPEGYFYKAHYKVKLKEYSEILSTDTDILISKKPTISLGGRYGFYYFNTSIPYGLKTGDRIKIVYENGNYREYFVSQKTKGTQVVFYDINTPTEDIVNNVKFVYLCNNNIPQYAYYSNDGLGRYVWRELLNESEIPQNSDIYNRTYANGAIYINTNVNFFLRRQDPYGIYGLKYTYETAPNASAAALLAEYQINGVETSIPDTYYKTEEMTMLCEN